MANESPRIIMDTVRLDVAKSTNAIRTDRELAKRAGITDRTLRNIRNSGNVSMDILEKIAIAVNWNPIDLIATPGYPDPKSVAPVGHLTLMI